MRKGVVVCCESKQNCDWKTGRWMFLSVTLAFFEPPRVTLSGGGGIFPGWLTVNLFCKKLTLASLKMSKRDETAGVGLMTEE